MPIQATLRRVMRSVGAPFATASAGLGGIMFHAGHGPEHFFCISLAAGIAVSGVVWGFYNRVLRPWLERRVRRKLEESGEIPF